MHCFACGHGNRPEARFCGGCGLALALPCPACGHANPADQRFCDACGNTLAVAARPDAAPAGAGAAPRSYTPAHLAQKILTSRSALEGERKQVTVLFCDLADSTALTRRIGADAMHELLNRFFELALAEVHGVEGTINQFLGDGFMALFGAPVAHEDHVRRALLAAQGIRRQLQASTALDGVRVRMGVNTGPVVVGRIGDNLRMDYTAVGDTTNLAARLQSIAQPGSVCVSEAVVAGGRAWFEFAPLGEHSLKGVEQAVAVHEMLRPRARGAADAGARGQFIGSALVGRDRELVEITDALAALRAGVGSLLLLVGEPGAGKSRLLAESRRLPGQADLRWLEGRAVSFGRNLSYLPFIEILRSCFDIADDETEALGLRKLGAGLQALFGERTPELLPYLATVLALKVPAELQERVRYLDGPGLKRQVFLCMRQLFERLAWQQPLVLVLEDWHWADPSSLELAEHLLPLTLTTPLLALFPTRAEPDDGLQRVRRFAADTPGARLRELALPALSSQHSGQLVDNLVGRLDLPLALRAQILRRTEGNPFFIEEVIRSLISDGVLVRGAAAGEWRLTRAADSLQLPDTLQGLILARIDRLDEDAKQALKLASVIGRSFFDRVLAAISEPGAALAGQLAALEQAELVRDKQRDPEPEHIFKHALVQEAAYGSMLAESRRAVHRHVAQAFETLFADRLDEFTSLLAHHYTSAEDWDKAQAYLFKAGDQAGRMAADAEALEHFRQAEAAYLKVYGDRLAPLPRAALARKVGAALYGTGQYERAHAQMRQALGHLGIVYPTTRGGARLAILRYLGAHLARRARAVIGRPQPRDLDTEQAAEISTIAHLMSWMDYFLDKERMLLDSLIELHVGERSRHALAEARGLSSVGFGLMTFGIPGLSRRYHHRAMVAARLSGDASAITFAWFARGWLEFYVGRWDSSESMLERAVRGYRDSGDIHRWAGASTMLLLVVHLRGDLDRAHAMATELLQAGRDAGDPQVASWGLQNLGFPGLARGPLAEVEARLREGQALARSIPSWDNLMFQKGLLAKCLALQGRLDEAQAEVDEALAIIQRERLALPFDQAEVLTAAAQVALARARASTGAGLKAAAAAALAAGRRAVQCTRRMPLWLPQALRLQGSAQWLAGDAAAARHSWQESLDLAQAYGFRVEAALARLDMGQHLDRPELVAQASAAFAKAGAHLHLAQAQHAQARVLHREAGDAGATAQALRSAAAALESVGATADLVQARALLASLAPA
jgi:class 3 adenylate cyclase/tetratricopeptide (TPR) repeat protein